MFRVPRQAKIYLLLAAFCFALPTLAGLYKGQSGKLLVSTHKISEGVFHESVIYLSRHTLTGAQGFILNKPLTAEAIAALPEDIKATIPENIPPFEGGPVAFPIQRFLGWIGQETGTVHTLPAFPDVLFEDSSQSPPRDGRMPEGTRLFLGYAGWAPLQLNREYLRGAWIVMDADPDLMFRTPPEDMWPEAARRTGLGKVKKLPVL